LFGSNIGGQAGIGGPFGGFALFGGGVQVHYLRDSHHLVFAPYLVAPNFATAWPSLKSLLSPRELLNVIKSQTSGFGDFASLEFGPVIDYNITEPEQLGGLFIGGEGSLVVPVRKGLGVGGHAGYLFGKQEEQFYGGVTIGTPGVGVTSQATYTFGPWSIKLDTAIAATFHGAASIAPSLSLPMQLARSGSFRLPPIPTRWLW
jgi:hypothetical protein